MNYHIPQKPTAEEWNVIDTIIHYKRYNNNKKNSNSQKIKKIKRINKNRKFVLANNQYLIATSNIYKKNSSVKSNVKELINEQNIINID